METPYQQLIEDHKHLLSLLRLLRKEVEKYDDTEQVTDVNLVLEALDYLNDYPQSFHHPLEEAAFDFMLEHGVGNADVIHRIREQHEDLEQKTAELQQLFQMVSSDQVVPVSRIKESLNDYLDLQFEHLQTEEREIFPAMKEHLGDEQWKHITRSIESRRDPLFTGTALSYPELARRLGPENR